MPRWLRVLILFLMVLSLVIYISPLQVEASSIVASIAGVTAVNVPAGLVYAAAAIALGVAAGTNDDFVNMVGNAVSSAGNWIQNGTVELLQTVDTLGQKTYYVAGQMMDDLRSWLFADSGLLISDSSFHSTASGDSCILFDGTYYKGDNLKIYRFVTVLNDYRVSYITYITSTTFLTKSNTLNGDYSSLGSKVYKKDGIIFSNVNNYQSKVDNYLAQGYSLVSAIPEADELESYSSCEPIFTTHDLTLDSLPSQTTDLTDGSSARAWSETYTNNGLYVVEGGGSDPEPPDENNGKWFWPLAFTIVAGELYLMSQSDQWSGVTPPEFGDYTTNLEYEILSRPEVEFGQGIEIAPLTSPSPDTGGDTGEDPETDPDTGGEVQTDYTTWFSRLYTTVENISGKFDEIKTTFQTWITDCSTAIEAIPSKFADWFANLKTSVDTFASNAQDAWSQTVTSIQSLPASMVDALDGLLPGDGSGGSGGSNPPSDHNKFALGDLTKFFPFCIPFDLYDFFTLLRADPVAPVLSWEIRDLSGQTYTLTVDLAEWDSVALLFRRLQLFLFICGLAAASRKYIKW